NLETASAPAATKSYFNRFNIDHDLDEHEVDIGGTIKASLIVVTGFDDNADIRFKNGSTVVLELEGSGLDGAETYTIPLSQPLTINGLELFCSNNLFNCRCNVSIAGS